MEDCRKRTMKITTELVPPEELARRRYVADMVGPMSDDAKQALRILLEKAMPADEFEKLPGAMEALRALEPRVIQRTDDPPTTRTATGGSQMRDVYLTRPALIVAIIAFALFIYWIGEVTQ